MSAYATLADLLDRYEQRELIQLTDDAGTGAIDAVRIDKAIQGASSIVDGYLAATYQLPLARVPDNIVDLTCTIARFKLWRSTPPDNIQKAYDGAVKMLGEISRGIVKIDAGEREQPARDGAIVTEGGRRVFDRDKLQGY